jgi:hypothetical protein
MGDPKVFNPWEPIGYIADNFSQIKYSASRSISSDSSSISALISVKSFVTLKSFLEYLEIF